MGPGLPPRGTIAKPQGDSGFKKALPEETHVTPAVEAGDTAAAKTDRPGQPGTAKTAAKRMVNAVSSVFKKVFGNSMWIFHAAGCRL
jgi:hypothetical protein